VADQEAPALSVEELSPGFGHIVEDALLDILRTSLGMDAEGAETSCENGYVLVRADDRVLAKAESLLRALQERLLATATIQHSGRLAPADGSGEPVVLHQIVMPTLLGREATVCRVLETNFVRDQFSEIAQEATMLTPLVEPVQSGTWLRVRVAPLGQDLHAQMLIQCVHAPAAPLRNVAPTGGLLMPQELASTRAWHDGSAVRGQTIEHGDGPVLQLDGRAFRSTLSTVVR
jgi:hypothetical protein